jgi:ABC-type Fe3+ transport system permease subunit
MFWDLFVRCLWFSCLQSVLSAALVLFLGSFVAWWVVSSSKSICFRFVESLGTWLFALPSLFVAFWYMAIARNFIFLPSAGLGALVIANVLGATLFAAFHLAHHLKRALQERGDQYAAALSLWGCRDFWFWYFLVTRPLFMGAKKLFPILFVSFFSSFSLVLMLAESPSYSSLEVLLFISLLNDFDFQKALILIFSQTAINTLFILWLSRSRDSVEVAAFDKQDVAGVLKNLDSNSKNWFSRVGMLPVVLLTLLLVVGIFPSYWDILGGPPAGFYAALGVTVKLLALALTLFLVQTWIFLRLKTSYLKPLAFLMAITPVLWAGIGFLFRLDVFVEESQMASFFVAAFFLNLLVAGYFAFDLYQQKSQIPQHEAQLMQLWGASTKERFRYWEWPYVRKSVYSSFLLLSLWTLSDVAISGVYLMDQSTLANHARTLASRYDFRGFSWILLLSLLYSVFVFLLRSRYEKGARVRI